MVIGIIGGGASGMAAALAAAGTAQVILFERQARVGRKLQATGNGRCNLTNVFLKQSGYHGDQPDFAEPALSAFDALETMNWFQTLGLYTFAETSGRVYPYSNQANSVVDVLRFALERAGVELRTGFEVTRVRRSEKGFTVEGNGEAVACDRLIIACGGLAGTKLGGSMSGYQLLRSLGHKMTKLRPALVQLRSDWSGTASLKGVRADCRVEILCDGVPHADSEGEIQFTEYGVSGPVIFEVSRDACQKRGDWVCRLDFAPEIGEEYLLEDLQMRREMNFAAEDLLLGMLHNRLGRVLTKAAGISGKRMARELTEEDLDRVCHTVKAFEISLTEPLGMDSAQVTAGGILTSEFDPQTMESKLVPGLYACGEVLDIDGDCGGYNLQWAWSSGRCAGSNAGKERK